MSYLTLLVFKNFLKTYLSLLVFIYWYSLLVDKNFSYEPHLCNGCHDLMEKVMSFNDVAIVSIKGSDYRIHFWYMSKDDAISIMHNSNLIDQKGTL